ncbi:MAG TPA: helix-turn-helix transcriptional regulator [Thermoanaerobaculia bacterium]|nr:helix-turn-helix transcriptional regulator [Thermoanaerobaculia bacterium]
MTRARKTRPKRPAQTVEPPGQLLRLTRERAQLSQHELALRLGCTQQAVAQAERRESNPTFQFMRRWVKACGAALSIRIRWRSG